MHQQDGRKIHAAEYDHQQGKPDQSESKAAWQRQHQEKQQDADHAPCKQQQWGEANSGQLGRQRGNQEKAGGRTQHQGGPGLRAIGGWPGAENHVGIDRIACAPVDVGVGEMACAAKGRPGNRQDQQPA